MSAASGMPSFHYWMSKAKPVTAERNNRMSARTVPPPSNDEFSTALHALRFNAKHYGLDTTEEGVHSFITQQAEVRAQMAAEIRWLRNMIHPK